MRFRGRVLPVACLAGLAVAGCGSGHGGTGTGATPSTTTHARPSGTGGPTQAGGGKLGPEEVLIEEGPSLAPASTTTPGTPVDGIRCPAHEALVYHIHAHLQVYVDGQPRQLPGGIGIIEPVAEQTRYGPVYAGSRCYYWLHTHAADGIIHIESPIRTIFTLGQFFDEWRQPLGPDVVATAHGPVTAYVNGRRWTRNPRDIRFLPHAVIQLDVGQAPVPFKKVSFGGLGL